MFDGFPPLPHGQEVVVEARRGEQWLSLPMTRYRDSFAHLVACRVLALDFCRAEAGSSRALWGSRLMFWKGSTAMEGLSGSGSGWLGTGEAFAAGVEASLSPDWTLHARMGSAMFFKA
jgi:hypothetical protein